MSTSSEPLPSGAPDDLRDLDLLADALAPIAPADDRSGGLRERLLGRVRESRALTTGVSIVRRRRGDWTPYVRGVRYKLLHQRPGLRSLLVEFAPGATLPAHRHGHHEECVVLSGGLSMGSLRLGEGDYHVAPAGSRHGGLISPEGALIYLRGAAIGSSGAALREVIGAWLPGSREHPTTVFAGDAGWTEPLPGIHMKELWVRDGFSSRLYRFDAGAGCAAHEHRGDEECVMLAGDLFFGDELLCAGDYQCVSAGGRHGSVRSDAGALLFVHGPADEAEDGCL